MKAEDINQLCQFVRLGRQPNFYIDSSLKIRVDIVEGEKNGEEKEIYYRKFVIVDE